MMHTATNTFPNLWVIKVSTGGGQLRRHCGMTVSQCAETEGDQFECASLNLIISSWCATHKTQTYISALFERLRKFQQLILINQLKHSRFTPTGTVKGNSNNLIISSISSYVGSMYRAQISLKLTLSWQKVNRWLVFNHIWDTSCCSYGYFEDVFSWVKADCKKNCLGQFVIQDFT